MPRAATSRRIKLRPPKHGLGIGEVYTPRGWHAIFVDGDKGRLYTTCIGCGTLLYREDGPRCAVCQAPITERKRRERRARKQQMGKAA